MVPAEVCGNVVEIFSGIQGEGTHVGRRHIFLRLAGCDFDCDYCDQPEARNVPREALIEINPGRRNFVALPNPLSAQVAARAVLMLHYPPGLHEALAVTGGEPLMQPKFLAAVLTALRPHGIKVLLETNGTRPEALRALRHLIDIVSMDFKLRSATGRRMPVTAHRRFLRVAARHGAEVYVKAVVSSATTAREVEAAARTILRVRKPVPLVLQPVTCSGRRSPKPPTAERLLELQAAAARILPDVRVIPQTHKMIGQR